MIVATSLPKKQSMERRALLERYARVMEENTQVDRKLVSFQGNRKSRFLNWLRYKEAFSARLARELIDQFHAGRGSVLDPFAGTGTALFSARMLGIPSLGIELMPVGFSAVDSILAAENVDAKAFRRAVNAALAVDWARQYEEQFAFRHLGITRHAFPADTERAICGFRAYCRTRLRNANIRKLFEFAGMAVLESVSYTRKDGQYLRWDYRAGKPRVKARFDKGTVFDFPSAISHKLEQLADDVSAGFDNDLELFTSAPECPRGSVDIRQGSCLNILPALPSRSAALIVTSPPYCNRYDYTRTYALELAYLDHTEDDVKRLRQTMLSCTVENRDKRQQLQDQYRASKRLDHYRAVCQAYDGLDALHETLEILEKRARSGMLNNTNIPRMVRNYFFEMAFVVFEMTRVLRPGGRVVMVNDNVRYDGEEVPVDLLLSELASRFGLTVERIWVLPRGKGNSSQQMGRHGRSELRKGIYIWRKR